MERIAVCGATWGVPAAMLLVVGVALGASSATILAVSALALLSACWPSPMAANPAPRRMRNSTRS